MELCNWGGADVARCGCFGEAELMMWAALGGVGGLWIVQGEGAGTSKLSEGNVARGRGGLVFYCIPDENYSSVCFGAEVRDCKYMLLALRCLA